MQYHNKGTILRTILSIIFLAIQWSVRTRALSALSGEYWRNIVVQPSIPISKNSLNLHNDSTVLSMFSSQEASDLNEIVTSFLLSPSHQMWSKIDSISENTPFVFYHQRKAGGSSVRMTLFVSAENAQLSTFIPCFNNVSCDTYTVPASPAYAIYAGHLKWGALDAAARVNSDIRHKYSCGTNYRHPYSRIESCLYFRFADYFAEQNITCLHDLSLAYFKDLLFKLDGYGNSCLNEPFRVLSGIADEYLLDHLTDSSGLSSSTQRKLRVENDLLKTILKLTLQHTQKCPPLVLELPASYELMTNRAQFFNDYDSFSKGTMVNELRKVSCEKLHGEHLQLVKQFASLEMILYDAVFRKTVQRVYEELPSSFILDMVCTDQNSKRVSPVDSAGNKTQLRPPVLIIVDETFEKALLMGQLVEFATGESTGGNAPGIDVSLYLKEFSECKADYASIFVPVTRVSLQSIVSSVTDNSAFFRIEQGDQCLEQKLRDFGNAVLVWKDPFVEYYLLIKQLFGDSANTQQMVDGLDLHLSSLKVTLQDTQNEEDVTQQLYSRYFERYMSMEMFRLLYAKSLVSRVRRHRSSSSAAMDLTRAMFDVLLSPEASETDGQWPRFATRQVLHVSKEALLLSAQYVYRIWVVRHSLYNVTSNALQWRDTAPSFSTLLAPPHGSYYSHVPYIINSQENITSGSNTSVSSQKRKRLTSLHSSSSKHPLSSSMPSSHSLLSLLTFINGQNHKTDLLYPSKVEDGQRSAKSAMLQRIGCVFPNLMKTKPTRDSLQLNEQMVSFYKTHPTLLKYVTQEVAHVLSTFQIASESVSFTFSFERH